MAHVGSPALYPIKREEEEEKKIRQPRCFKKKKKEKKCFLCFNTRCVWGFPFNKQFRSTAGCSTIYLDSDTMYLSECTVRSHSLRAQSQETVTGFMSILGSRSPDYPQLLYDLAINQKFPKAASSGLMYLLEQLLWATSKTRGRCMFTSWVKNVIKDTDEQTGEETHRLRSGWLLSLWSRGPSLSWYIWMCSPNWNSPNPMLLGFYVGFLI